MQHLMSVGISEEEKSAQSDYQVIPIGVTDHMIVIWRDYKNGAPWSLQSQKCIHVILFRKKVKLQSDVTSVALENKRPT